MSYPFWDVQIGYGVLMAIIAILHVFVSHFAIGGGLYLVVAETFARKKNDELMLQFLQKLSKFFLLVTVVFGALSGVGIWFIIGLLNPAGTEVLIHNYVWGWASEWTFFIMEITAVILYFYGWNRLSAKNHLIIGWIYFIAAWMSLFIINGIITFMLSPGDWLATGNFWDGFFNPTFWSSLWLRTGICIMLAGVYALLVASREKNLDFKKRLVRSNAIWGLAGLVIMIPTLFWYIDMIPVELVDAAKESVTLPVGAMNATFINAALLGITLILFGLLIPKRYNIVIGVIAMLFALSWFGEYEFVREAVRKPYVVTNYMYANGIELAKAETYQNEGLLPSIEFRTGDDGADLFRRACRSCHTIDGYKALKPHFDGTDETFIAQSIMGTGVMRGNMPPFLGTEEEAQMIAAHLVPMLASRHLADIYGL
ncbi:MAG: cytochrome C, partial [Calditrichaeota bacterium]